MALELDFMEGYSTDALAQAAYVTNDTGTTTVTQSNTEITGADAVDPTAPKLGQGFKTSTTDKVTKFTFQYKKSTGATGTLTGYIYDDNAGKPNAAVATFSAIAMADLTTSYADYDFTGTFTPVIGTQYHAVVVWTGGSGGDIWWFNINNTNPYANGVYEYYVTSTGLWTSTTSDFYFKIWQNVPNLQSYSEATIKTQGSYALKGVAVITDSLNKTLTRTVSPTIDLSDKNTIKYWAYALRTGSNFKIGWRDSGLNVIEHTPNIIQSNTWEEQTVDISAVTNADKDAIDRIIFTVLNADAANIIYLDKMFSPQQFTKTFDETLTLSEVISKAPARTFLETITLSESSFIKGIGKTFTETITLSETFGRAISKLLKDTVTLTEVAARDIAIFFQETITLTDNIAKGITRTLSDSLSLTDVFTKVLKWLHISHIATTWNKVTKTLTNWTKTNRTNTPWHKKYE